MSSCNFPAFSSHSPTKTPSKQPTNFPRSGENTAATSTTNQACAACKYLRRKCARDCLLAPYFPHNRQRQFLNVHRLFGVSNVSKIIKSMNPSEKDAAMNTIIFQADARFRDPVGGCYRIIRELQYQIEFATAELELTLQNLAMLREQGYQRSQVQETEDVSSFSCSSDHNSYATPNSYLSLQEDARAMQIQDSSAAVNRKRGLMDESEDAKLIEEICDERNGLIEFSSDEFVETKVDSSSTQLVMLS